MSTRQKFEPEPVPDELKERAQWLLWDASKDRKQPFTLKHGRLAPASWTAPADWLTFEDVTDDTAPPRRDDDQKNIAVSGGATSRPTPSPTSRWRRVYIEGVRDVRAEANRRTRTEGDGSPGHIRGRTPDDLFTPSVPDPINLTDKRRRQPPHQTMARTAELVTGVPASRR